MSEPVTVYVLSGCPYCVRAIALLRRRGIEHEVISGDGIPGFRQQLAATTGGWTVPQIVIGDRPVGGSDHLARLDRRGVLAALVAGESMPVLRVRRRRLRPVSSRWVAEMLDADGTVVARASGPDADTARSSLPGNARGAASAA